MTNRQDIVIKYNLRYSKIVEQYLQLLEIYKKKLNHDKIALLMRVGDFYEVYGLVYKDENQGKAGASDTFGNIFSSDNHVGNLWNIAEDLVLRIGKKNQSAYGCPNIDVFMAGIPTPSLDKYINVAVESWGWSVVVIDQEATIDPITTEQKITRYESMIISPGTNSYSSDETNTLMIIYLERVASYSVGATASLYAGIAFLDCLTGFCGTLQYPTSAVCNDAIIYDEIVNQLTIRNPAEVVVHTKNLNISESELINTLHLHYRNNKIYMESKDIKLFEKKEQQVAIFAKIFPSATGLTHIFEDLNLWDFPYSRTSLAMMLEYITLRNPNILEKIAKPHVIIQTGNHLVLANNALEQLNIINTLGRSATRHIHGNHQGVYEIMKRTKTAMGQRLFKQRLMNPITNPAELTTRYNLIDAMSSQSAMIPEILKIIAPIADFKRIERQLAQGNFPLHNLPTLHESLLSTRALHKLLSKGGCGGTGAISSLLLLEGDLLELENLIHRLNSTFCLNTCVEAIGKIEGTIFQKGVYSDIDSIQADIDADSRLLADLQSALSNIVDGGAKKDIINLGQNTAYNHYLFTTPQRVETIRKHFESRTKPLFIGGGRYVISAMDFKFEQLGKGKVRINLECIKESGAKLVENTIRLRTETQLKYREWQTATYSAFHLLLDKLEEFIASIDLIQSCSRIAKEKGLIRPVIDVAAPQSFLHAVGLRHPIIEEIQTDIPYVANDISLGSENSHGILLFGVNAVGKSSLMKSIGIAVIMAQAGFFVSADSFRFKPYDYLFTRIQSNDNIYAGLSSFAVEMSEFKVIMKYANSNSIILGDELCSGTETLDATALVASGINKLAERRASFIFATHLHYLSTSQHITKLPNVRMVHLSVAYDQAKRILVYERKLRDGSGPSSYGIEVCKAMNMDEDYMALAQTIRQELTASTSGNTTTLIGKQSVYNADKLLDKCEVCNSAVATDTHHIKFQCSADSEGMIEHWHKDSKFNLVGLCKMCHQRVHAVPATLEISGYCGTSSGVELKFRFLESRGVVECQDAPDTDNDTNIKGRIMELHSRNLSPKKIQVRMKTLYNTKVKLEEIRNYVISG